MSFESDASSGNGASILGSIEPRIWTPPLRELTPETSYGFDVCEFARDPLGHPLDPWQEWLAIHAGELLPDGRPRFRKVLVLVSRQNGKTEVVVVLTLFWLFVDRVPMVLGTSTKLDYAAESWRKACRLARQVEELDAEVPAKGGIRKANGEQVLWRADAIEQVLDEGSRYKIAASNEEGGRSLTIDRLVLDELRQHHDYSAWDAAVPATNAVWDAQIWAMSNAGSDRSVVLNDTRDAAIKFIESGEGDPRLGIFEWSAPEGSSPLDLNALAQANPNLGRRIDPDALIGDARVAVEKGGDKLAGFLTENMCIRVKIIDSAVDGGKWAAEAPDGCLEPGDLADVRARVALCLDVSIDGLHASLVAAAMLPDNRVRVEVVEAWEGAGCTQAMREALPGIVRRIKPQKIGWFPNGPAAAVAADLADRKRPGRAAWPPPGVTVEQITRETTAVCMGLAEHIRTAQIAHSGDPLLDAHVLGAEKLMQGDAWRFTRKGAGHCDAAYAAAGAVHLARTLPPPPQKAVILRGRRAGDPS
ncbi:terminase [Amycolatopsis solani]|uniref:terminase n=1 Tax=Amycolatopsis solani TaxID=3028615 RepID=UPI0025B1C4A4|nr:terminase [Amycolatopsis sp. MEP2-6]